MPFFFSKVLMVSGGINSLLTSLLTCFYHCQALLHFIYWDDLPDMEELTGLNTKWVSTLMAQHLLAAADRYALERLKLLCEKKLCEEVAINTVATTLALAEQHHCHQLKAICLKFVAMPENLRGIPFLPFLFDELNAKTNKHQFLANCVGLDLSSMPVLY